MYFFTALVAASIVATVEFAGAGQPDAQCKGNSPKKVCPTLLPADGASVSGTVTVTAELEEEVVSVIFDVDNTPLALPDLAAPYEVRWDTTKWSNGTHVLRATALNSSGKLAAREHRITVSNATAPPPPPPPPPPPSDTTSPSVALTSPAAGATVSGSVSIAANATDNVAVTGVQFKVDGANVGAEDTSAPYSANWSTTSLSNGNHTVTAVARDAAGNTSSSQRSVTVSNSTTPPPPPPGDTTPPSVTLTSPAAGATVSDSVSIAANATDDVGVVGVQFKVDGMNIGREDTSAPYSVNWDTTAVANGTHTVTAVARDAAAHTSSSQRSVSVSNTTAPPPEDLTPPTVGLTSPAAGATVSGSVSLAAIASDNVGVVGVQFKVDGTNVGAEDTTAPYSVSWSSNAVGNGSHTVTAVAQDAAGNRSSSQRSVTVSNPTTPPPPPPSGPKVAWAPPALSNPATITVTNANRRLYLDNSRDYRLNIVEPLRRELWIEGGRNVVVVGGRITIDQLGGDSSYQDNTALKIRYGAAGGTVHVEGLLIDGPYVADGVALATPRNVQLQNVRIERVTGLKGAHPDCIQTQQGVGALRVDRFSCSSDLQGIFLRDDIYPIGPSDFRHVNITGAPGKHLFWQTTPKQPIRLTEVWLHTDAPWGPFGWWVYPNTVGKTWDNQTDMSRVAVVSADGSYLWFTGASNTITGRINKGRPPGGDFVPRSAVGVDYVSPGYG